jgi:hypothetical protein
MIVDVAFLTFSIKHPRFRVWYFEKIKQGGLLDLVLYTFIGMITGKCFFSHGVEQFGIKCGWIIYFSGIADHAGFLGAVITKVGANTKGNDIIAIFKTGLERDDFSRFFPGHVNNLCMISRLRRIWLPDQYIRRQ